MSSKLRKVLIPLVILGLLAFLGYSLTQKPQAPTINFVTLEGKTIPLSSLQGKMVLVNFWATDCPGCIAEMPGLVETYNQYKDKGFEVIAVAMSYDAPQQVINYTQKNALPFPVTHDSQGEAAHLFSDVRVTPTSFIVDQQGRITQKLIGELDFKSLRSLLDKQLSGNH
ncbi:TlpA family protein disulfide reductase [Methylobacillus gramineus]|uniref:peroxiredoxin family protein n=1 Tax=Methylobacillus gramineus TaxID=755169 RepID=UPI001CFFEB3A|nr:TlpA disulfide reductase family protein [Methylobacillus gramineus]MCB5185196.1 TlpA family protein disulfide reductase [Methylobacillus gramineus]